jgi:hypothetical protein
VTVAWLDRRAPLHRPAFLPGSRLGRAPLGVRRPYDGRFRDVPVVRLLPGNRYRLLLSRTFTWLPDGPIQQFFKAQAQNEYFRTRFDGPDELMLFVAGRLSKSSREAMLVRLRRVANEFSDAHADDMRRPFEECTGMNMLLAIRPWELSAFSELRRKK